MNKYDYIDEILDELISSGSQIDYIKELREDMVNISNKDRDLKEVLSNIAFDIENYTRAFLETKNKYETNVLEGISTLVYLPDYEGNGSYKYKVIGGNRTRGLNDKIDEDTLFDIASITKLYTLVLLFKLEELGLIDFNTKISDLNPDFQNLEDYTINDLVRMCGTYYTDGNVAMASSQEEAYERLKSLYLTSNDRTKGKYNDFGPMVIGYTIERVISSKLGKNMNLSEIMNEFLFKPLYINNTVFTPKIINITGNTMNDGLPHDPKSRILGGVTAHAGLFTNSEDLALLADGLFKGFLNQKHMDKFSEVTFKDYVKGNMGLYLKDKDGWANTFTPPEFSNKSFSHQGFTGSVASFDPVNHIHNNILVNAIKTSDNKDELCNCKPILFRESFGMYQQEITKKIMLMYIAKKYYNKYINIKENINEYKLIV